MQRSATKDGVSSKIVVKTCRLTGFGESKVVSGAIGNTPCDFIIDTWSNITILRPDFWKCKTVEVTLEATFLRTVIGESVPVRGKTTVKMRLGNYEADHVIWVADVVDQCIVGLDFLLQHNCQVDVGNALLKVGPDGTDEEGKRQ